MEFPSPGRWASSSPRVLNPSPDRDPSTHTEPHLRPVWLLQVWDGYVQYRMFGLSVTVAGTGLGVGRWVSGILNIPHPWEPPDLCKVGGSPILGVVEAGHLPCRVVRFPPPVGPGPVSPVHPVCHAPSVGWAVEAFFTSRDLAAGTCRTYRQALGPLVETVGADRPVTDLCPDRVAAVFEELWADRAPATWNTRRGRHPGVRFVVWGPVAPSGESAGR